MSKAARRARTASSPEARLRRHWKRFSNGNSAPASVRGDCSVCGCSRESAIHSHQYSREWPFSAIPFHDYIPASDSGVRRRRPGGKSATAITVAKLQQKIRSLQNQARRRFSTNMAKEGLQSAQTTYNEEIGGLSKLADWLDTQV